MLRLRLYDPYYSALNTRPCPKRPAMDYHEYAARTNQCRQPAYFSSMMASEAMIARLFTQKYILKGLLRRIPKCDADRRPVSGR